MIHTVGNTSSKLVVSSRRSSTAAMVRASSLAVLFTTFVRRSWNLVSDAIWSYVFCGQEIIFCWEMVSEQHLPNVSMKRKAICCPLNRKNTTVPVLKFFFTGSKGTQAAFNLFLSVVTHHCVNGHTLIKKWLYIYFTVSHADTFTFLPTPPQVSKVCEPTPLHSTFYVKAQSNSRIRSWVLVGYYTICWTCQPVVWTDFHTDLWWGSHKDVRI